MDREGGEGNQDAINSGNLGIGVNQSPCQVEILEDEDRTKGDKEKKLEDLDQIQKKGNQPGNVEEKQQENLGLGHSLATSSKKDLQSKSNDMLVIDLSDSGEADEVQYVCSVQKQESEKTKLSGNPAEGVKSAADDESVVNEDVAQPLTTETVAAAIAAPVPPRPAFHHKLAQAPAPAVENKLNEVRPWNSLANNRGTWSFVNKCLKGCDHPKPCVQVKCPAGKASAPAKGYCRAKMNLANLWNHMQKVHNSQEFNLHCPACGVKVSCSALQAHMVNNHNGYKPKLSARQAPVPPYTAYGPTLPVPPLNHTFVTPSNSHPELSKAVPENQVIGVSPSALNKVPEKHHPGTIWVNKDIFKR